MPKKLKPHQLLANECLLYAENKSDKTKQELLARLAEVFGFKEYIESEYWQCREFLHEYYDWYSKSPKIKGRQQKQPTQANTKVVDAHLKMLMNALKEALPHLENGQQQIRFYDIANKLEEDSSENSEQWWSDLHASVGLVYYTLKKHFEMRSQGGRSKNALIDSMVEPLIHFWMDALKKGYTPSFEASEYAKNGVRMPTGEMACFIFCTLAVEFPEQSKTWLHSLPAKLKNYRSIAMSRAETTAEFA